MSVCVVSHSVCAEVTDVIATNKHGDHFPVIMEIEALKEIRSKSFNWSIVNIKLTQGYVGSFLSLFLQSYRIILHFVH